MLDRLYTHNPKLFRCPEEPQFAWDEKNNKDGKDTSYGIAICTWGYEPYTNLSGCNSQVGNAVKRGTVLQAMANYPGSNPYVFGDSVPKMSTPTAAAISGRSPAMWRRSSGIRRADRPLTAGEFMRCATRTAAETSDLWTAASARCGTRISPGTGTSMRRPIRS